MSQVKFPNTRFNFLKFGTFFDVRNSHDYRPVEKGHSLKVDQAEPRGKLFLVVSIE